MVVSDINGRKVYINPAEIVSIDEAGASSNWHGIRTVITLSNKRVIEAQDSFGTIIKMVTDE
jgi:hypothetical protein